MQINLPIWQRPSHWVQCLFIDCWLFMMQIHDFIPRANATLASKQKHTVDVEDCLLPLPCRARSVQTPGDKTPAPPCEYDRTRQAGGQRKTAMREKICNLSPKSISSPAETEEQRPQVFQWHMCSMIRNQSRNGEALSIDEAEWHFQTLATIDVLEDRCCWNMGTWLYSNKKKFHQVPTNKLLCQLTHVLHWNKN